MVADGQSHQCIANTLSVNWVTADHSNWLWIVNHISTHKNLVLQWVEDRVPTAER